MLRRYTRPRDFCSAKLNSSNNTTKKKNKAKGRDSWIGQESIIFLLLFFFLLPRSAAAQGLAGALRFGRAEGGLPRGLPRPERSASPSFALNCNEKSISSQSGLIRSPRKGPQ